MSFNAKNFTTKKNREFDRLTPEEMKLKEEERKRKEAENKAKAEQAANEITEKFAVIIGKTRQIAPSDLDGSIVLYTALSTFLNELREIHRPYLCDASKNLLIAQDTQIDNMLSLIRKVFKETLYARMTESLAVHDFLAYENKHHPLAFKAYNANMMTWDEACAKLDEYKPQ